LAAFCWMTVDTTARATSYLWKKTLMGFLLIKSTIKLGMNHWLIWIQQTRKNRFAGPQLTGARAQLFKAAELICNGQGYTAPSSSLAPALTFL